LDIRNRLKGLPAPQDTVIKVVEVPPGPPVLATLLAEIYGPDAATRRSVAREVRKIFASVPFIVDVDASMATERPRLRVAIDQDQIEYFGVEQSDVYDTVQAITGGAKVGYSHRGEDRNPIPIDVRLPKSDLSWNERLASTPVPANSIPGGRGVVELGDVVHVSEEPGSFSIFRRTTIRRNGHGGPGRRFRGSIYGMLAVDQKIATKDWGKLGAPMISLHGQPTTRPSRRCCGTVNGK